MTLTHALGRLVDHDPRSREFAHFAAAKPLQPKTTRWTTSAPVLDQGQVGSCTGNAMAQWLNTDYAHTSTARRDGGYLDETKALELYTLATRLDGIPNNTYPGVDQGSSGNGVAKAARQLGFIRRYTWTFSMTGFLNALQTQPLIVGTAFYSSMEDPDRNGIVHASGSLEGGHEYLVLGVDYHPSFYKTAVIEWLNSWGDGWGLRGRAYTPIDEFARLLADRNMAGDVTAPRL
ncbi:hypothetical protein B1R94_02300 [Mycolicibacterium litorale]|nr:hypothetical protein B1R94_02300 [Mycolicibacterium litorale]